MPQVNITDVDGVAMGGGLELALACNGWVVAAEPGPRRFGLDHDCTRTLFLDDGTRQPVHAFLDGVPH